MEIHERYVLFNNEKLAIRVAGQYMDKTPCLRVTDMVTGEPYMTLTVCIPGSAELVAPGEFLVKGYRENKPLVDALLHSGVLERTKKSVSAGMGYTCHVCRWA